MRLFRSVHGRWIELRARVSYAFLVLMARLVVPDDKQPEARRILQALRRDRDRLFAATAWRHQKP
ncbi:MAG: hypothetical protein WDO56_03875 [Gammaproteobacteria bacterium]